MRVIERTLMLGALMVGAMTRPAAQAPAPIQPSREAVFAAARDIMSKAGYATLITVDATNAPQARVVDPFPVEDNWIVWVATTSASRKVVEIRREPRVALSYFDSREQGYVTLTGMAAIVRDPAEKAKRWKEAWSAFYKDKNRGDDYTLIRVTGTRLEVSSPSRGMNNDPITWKPVTVVLR
jgi:general stress protein 26